MTALTRRAMAGDWVADEGDRIVLVATAEDGRPRPLLPIESDSIKELTDGGPEGETALYRHFDATGTLLYVGISFNPLIRLSQHSQESAWFRQIANVNFEWFLTRIEALIAERNAIRTEKPKYNKLHLEEEVAA